MHVATTSRRNNSEKHSPRHVTYHARRAHVPIARRAALRNVANASTHVTHVRRASPFIGRDEGVGVKRWSTEHQGEKAWLAAVELVACAAERGNCPHRYSASPYPEFEEMFSE